MPLVTLDQAKAHLYVTDDTHDTDIQFKLDQASAIVVEYLKTPTAATWDEDTAPFQVQAATLILVTHLYESRGDDMATDANVWQAIERLLVRLRDPALA